MWGSSRRCLSKKKVQKKTDSLKLDNKHTILQRTKKSIRCNRLVDKRRNFWHSKRTKVSLKCKKVYCMHYIASVAVAVTISPLLLKFHSRHQCAVYRKCAEILRVHFIDYNKLWCLISFPLWVGFSSLFPQSYFVICLLCFLFEFCFGANGFLFMLKCNKLPTFHRTCSKPFFTTHKTLSFQSTNVLANNIRDLKLWEGVFFDVRTNKQDDVCDIETVLFSTS